MRYPEHWPAHSHIAGDGADGSDPLGRAAVCGRDPGSGVRAEEWLGTGAVA